MTVPPRHLTRRDWLSTAAAIGAGALAAGCTRDLAAASAESPTRLTARPGTPTRSGSRGLLRVALPSSEAVVYVPPSAQQAQPASLLVFLHGALRTVEFFVDGHRPAADRAGVIVLAPFSTAGSWDAVNGAFGPDVRIIDTALRWVFERWTIRADRVVLSGFSDGATYALGLGRANGDLFARVVAYSPGFLLPVGAVGRPPVLMSHGTEDTVLPIDQCSRVIAPQLRSLGYDVDYREFTGPHAVPQDVMEEVVAALGGG